MKRILKSQDHKRDHLVLGVFGAILVIDRSTGLPPAMVFFPPQGSFFGHLSGFCVLCIRDLLRNQNSGGTQDTGLQSLLHGIPSCDGFTLQDLGQLIPVINHSNRYLGTKQIFEN